MVGMNPLNISAIRANENRERHKLGREIAKTSQNQQRQLFWIAIGLREISQSKNN